MYNNITTTSGGSDDMNSARLCLGEGSRHGGNEEAVKLGSLKAKEDDREAETEMQPLCTGVQGREYGGKQFLSTTDKKSFKCDVCDYTTTHKSHLTRHSRIHTKERPYKCDICDYAAAQKGNLATHLRIHTKEKPYKCDVCEYTAVQKVHLIKHSKTHA